MNLLKSSLLALVVSVGASFAANAACTPPLAIKDGGGSSVNMSVFQGPDGSCTYSMFPLWYTGTSNNGINGSLLTLMTTELNSLTNTSVIISSVGGTSGVFSNSDTAGSIKGELFFNAGTAGAACAAGANIAGWLLQSQDSGSTFEPTAAVPARGPDFVVPLPATTLNATYKANGPVNLPALKFKVLVQNNCGASGTLAASGNTIKVAPVATLN